MANTFIIKEEVLNEVANIMKPTESQFNSNVRYFLHQLIADPVHAEIPTCIKMANISRSRFIKMLVDRGIVNRTERLNDTDKDGNHKLPTMAVKYTIVNKVPDELEYKVSKTDFDRRVEKLRRSIFEKNLPQKTFNTPFGDQLALAKNSPSTMGFIAPGEKKNDAASWLMNRAEEASNANLTSKKTSLNEDQESKSIDAAKKLYMQRTGESAEDADKFIRIDLRNDLPVLRNKNSAKFILGVTRMFLDRQLSDARTIQNLNKTIELLTQGHLNEYDRNLNGMSAQDLIQRFSTAMKQIGNQERKELSSMEFTANNDYQIVRIDDFEQASAYGQYTSWCVTHNDNMFNSYTSNGLGQFYFCLRNGFENEPKQPGEGCPLDSYGLSMIAVSVDEEGRLNTCTCRWNHDNGGNDNIMDVRQISEVIGRNFFEVFKPNGKWNEIINHALEELRSGKSPNEVFDECDDFKDGLAVVELNDKYNWIRQDNGQFLSERWFDYCGDFHDGLAVVKLNGKSNWLRQDNGQFLSERWFDYCGDFHDGLAWVQLNDKYNWIRADNGQFFSEQWFDLCGDFHDGLAWVQLNDKYNWIRADNGQFFSERWFDGCGNFHDGLAWVQLNDKYNWIRADKGQFFSERWFDYCGDFKDGLAVVKLNGKVYLMRKDGVLCNYKTKKPLSTEVLNEETSYDYKNNNPREESDKFTDDENEIIGIVNKEIKKTHRPKDKEKERYNIYAIRYAEFYHDDEVKTFAMNVVGGFNGSGDWFDYFKVLSDFCKSLEENGIRVFLIDAQNDCADDVYDMQFGLKKKNDELNEEGGDGGATSADASGAFVQPLFKTMVRREINEMIEALSPNLELNSRYRNLGGGFDVHLEDGSVTKSIVTVQNKKSKTLYHICFDGVNFNIFRDANDGLPAKHISYVFDELFNAFQQSGYTNMLEQKNGRVFKVTEEQMRLFKESTATTTVGGSKTDYQYTVPFQTNSDDETMQRHNGEGGSVSINHIDESNKESLHTSNVGDYINDNPIAIHSEDQTMKRGEGKHSSHGIECIEEGKKYVNMDVELRKGGRNAVKMSVDDFKSEMTHAYHEYAMEQSKEYKYDLQKTPTPSNFVYSLCYDNRDNEKSKIASMLHKDIWEGKYDFDSENVDAIGGIKMSRKGFPYIQCDAGGDWERPVCFFVYFDGNHFRAYVPLKGNALNRNDNHAFSGGGNENDAKFVQKELGVSYEEADSLCGDISYNLDACLEDFLSRVEVKGTYKKRDYTNDEKKFDEYRKKKKEEREEQDRKREEEQLAEYVETNENTVSPLNEDQESKSIDAAKKLYMQRTGESAENADKFIRIDLRNDLPVLRNKNSAKFILGVTRMFLDRQLSDARTIQNLNKTIELLTQGHANEYDRNLNGMSAQDLIQRFSTTMKQIDNQERKELSSMEFTANNDYQIVRIDDFEQASAYGQYTSWCVTHNDNMFNSYTSNGIGQFYFCLRNGFENEVKQPGEGCPLDRYGLSMIAVSVDEEGRLNTCTCRWNHDNGGNDNIMNVRQISEVIGRNFFEVFKPNGKWNEIINHALEELRSGKSPKDVFKYCGEFENGLAVVQLNGKWNWIRQDNLQPFSKEWFDGCSDFENGLASVILNGKQNWIRQDNLQLISEEWFDFCSSFYNGLAEVELNDKYNWLRQDNLQFFSKRWFDACGEFENGLAWVQLNDKYNWIRADNGQFLSEQWFDGCGYFNNGLAVVKLNGKVYLIREDGVLCDYKTGQPLSTEVLNEEENKFLEKHGIKEVSCGLGYSEKEQKWYGWSHRAIHGFGIGDKCVECYPTGTKKGKIIKTMEQAKEAAKKFAESVS